MFVDQGIEVKADPFTLEDFISWLETMPAERSYSFSCAGGGCLMGQYMAARGRFWGTLPEESCSEYWKSCEEVFGDPFNVGTLALHPQTFGAALTRAREALARR